nr:hypothetical protein [Streptomyces chartreusis]
MDDETGLINMNGRLYDPPPNASPPPTPTSTPKPQNWNPYSYVNNNPTNATDPTGYDPQDSYSWSSTGTLGTFSSGEGTSHTLTYENTGILYGTAAQAAIAEATGTRQQPLQNPEANPIHETETVNTTGTSNLGDTAQEIKLFTLGSISTAIDRIGDAITAAQKWYTEPIEIQHTIHHDVSSYPAATIAEREANSTETWTTIVPRGASLYAAIAGAAAPIIKPKLELRQLPGPATTRLLPPSPSAQDPVAYAKRLEALPGNRVFYMGSGADFAIRTAGNRISMDTSANTASTRLALEEASRSNPGAEFNVLSGSHGDMHGQWIATRPDPRYGNFGFYRKDVATANGFEKANVFDAATPEDLSTWRGKLRNGISICLEMFCFSSGRK